MNDPAAPPLAGIAWHGAVRIIRSAGRKLTQDGVLVITAQRFRTQERNREDALARLIDIIREASVAPKTRRPTRPTIASRVRRLESKKRHSETKAMRGRRTLPD